MPVGVVAGGDERLLGLPPAVQDAPVVFRDGVDVFAALRRMTPRVPNVNDLVPPVHHHLGEVPDLFSERAQVHEALVGRVNGLSVWETHTENFQDCTSNSTCFHVLRARMS